jgi:hypothetical protein
MKPEAPLNAPAANLEGVQAIGKQDEQPKE